MKPIFLNYVHACTGSKTSLSCKSCQISSSSVKVPYLQNDDTSNSNSWKKITTVMKNESVASLSDKPSFSASLPTNNGAAKTQLLNINKHSCATLTRVFQCGTLFARWTPADQSRLRSIRVSNASIRKWNNHEEQLTEGPYVDSHKLGNEYTRKHSRPQWVAFKNDYI